jgi:hypothetical protein
MLQNPRFRNEGLGRIGPNIIEVGANAYSSGSTWSIHNPLPRWERSGSIGLRIGDLG